MTAKSPETPMEDAELDALMAELEAETAGAIPPVVTVAKTVVAEPAAEVAEKAPPASVVEVAAKVAPVATAAPTPAPTAAPVVTPPAAQATPVAATPPPAAAKPVLAIVPPAAAPAQPEPAADPQIVKAAPTQAPGPQLKFHIDVGSFRLETAVSDIQLDKCMIEQNGLRAYYGEQAARSEAQASRVKLRFEVKEAQLYDGHRKRLALLAEKVTEKAIESAVKMDPIYAREKNLLIEADTIAAINKALVESLKDRRDMIIQLGADRRDEGKGQARILAQQDADQSLRSRAQEAAKR